MPRANLTAQRSRKIFGWSIAAFIALQLALTFTLEIGRPHRSDPEFEIRASLLKEAREAEPDHPLLLVVGSSRFVTAFRPERMPALKTATGETPLAFNFSHLGAGPLVNLIEVRRILAQGVRPRWMVMELLPAYLSSDATGLATSITATSDLGYLHRYGHALNLGKLYGRWLLARLLPCCKHRQAFAALVMPWMMPRGVPAYHPRGGFREENPDAEPDPALAARCIGESRARYGDVLREFCIDPDADAAVREAIVLAQQAGAEVVLMINPESTEFQSWYAPGAEARLSAFCRELAAAYHVPVVDARSWLPDREFMDGHHVMGAAATRYTEHFTRQVLQPFVDGRLQGVVRPATLP